MDAEEQDAKLRVLMEMLILWREAIQKGMYHYRTLHRITYLPQLIFQGTKGLFMIGASFGFQGEAAALYLPLCGGVIDILLTTYQPIRDLFGFAKRTETLEVAFTQLEESLVTLRFQLLLPKNKRTPPDDIVEQIKATLDQVVALEAILPESIVRELQQKRSTITPLMKLQPHCAMAKLSGIGLDSC